MILFIHLLKTSIPAYAFVLASPQWRRGRSVIGVPSGVIIDLINRGIILVFRRRNNGMAKKACCTNKDFLINYINL